MATHIKTVGILHICLGAFGVICGLLGLLLFGGIAALVGVSAKPEEAMVATPILGIIGVMALIVMLVLSLPSLIAGVGLMRFRPWARPFGIIVSALSLFNFPFGTAVGVYGLWALLATGSEQPFQRVQPMRQNAM